MDPKGAARALEALSKSTKPATPGDLRIFTISESGHYTFLDQPEEFLSHMMTTCQPYIDGSVRHWPLILITFRGRRMCACKWMEL